MASDLPTASAKGSLSAYARDALLFGACYIALDWASSVYPLGPFYITPWNPPPALSIVWMLIGGLRYAPVVFLGTLASELLLHEAPGGVLTSVITSFVFVVGYTGVAALLRLRFQLDGRLQDLRQLWTFIVAAASGAATVGIVYVSALAAAGFLFSGSYFAVLLRFWLGDTVGILVTAPLLMVAADPERRRSLLRSLRKSETVVQFIALLGTLLFLFRDEATPQQHFYLLFLPIIWIASRHGLGGAVVGFGIVQAGVVVGVQVGSLRALDIVELQALVTALTLTGLSLGIIVDERERVIDDLKRTLRLAAASEMAGAIAHEINQPLSALQNYGSACQIMLDQDAGGDSQARLKATVAKMRDESKRAADVVKRLRDLFRRGSTQLEPVTVGALIDRINIMAGELGASGDVVFRLESNDAARTLLVDRVQIELVLRNLLANAFEAVAGMPPGRKAVTVQTRMLDGERILFRVADTGVGMPAQVHKHLFEPLATNKPTGMGVGLAISRTIADAHGGSLRSSDRRHGQFDLVLPTGAGDA